MNRGKQHKVGIDARILSSPIDPKKSIYIYIIF